MIRQDETSAQMAKQWQTNWQAPRSMNTGAVTRSRNSGHSFIQVSSSIKTEQGNFAAFLDQASKKSASSEKSPAAANVHDSMAYAATRPKKVEGLRIQTGDLVKIEYDSFVSFLDQAAKMNNRPEQPPTGPKTNEFKDYIVKPGDTLWGIAVKKMHVNLKDIVSDNNIKNPDLITPGQIIRIRETPKSETPGEVVASWYGADFHGKPMANGSPYNMYANTIAHKDLPLGTKVELNNPRTGQKSTAVITDRGPFVSGRDVDLSYGLARKLSLVKEGVDTLVMRVL